MNLFSHSELVTVSLSTSFSNQPTFLAVSAFFAVVFVADFFFPPPKLIPSNNLSDMYLSGYRAGYAYLIRSTEFIFGLR